VRIDMLAMGLCGLLVPSGLSAQDARPDPKDKHAAVREISLEGLKAPAKGDVTKPKEISSEAEVVKVFEQTEVAARIKKAVDFGKQRLVYFTWSGSGGDRLTYTVGKRSDGPVKFRFHKGLTLDLRPHHHLYAIDKRLKWDVVSEKGKNDRK
jgi:hypothetical protein